MEDEKEHVPEILEWENDTKETMRMGRNFKKGEVISAIVFNGRTPLLLSQTLPSKGPEHIHLQIPIRNPGAEP